ncbi:uncharacterized protein LOC122078250 isoform X1 [Macadamia integrifolia]|uniref:uncharacterized protein LOC122078250 isoform X1 n=1 Tax=Macadamia integrifolia TaxID=60698 RepID=UPI001C4FEAE4|nr:uncharacterized protein LOC122078250 isoform X1 [Macadamia integrifolia]
MYLTRYLSQYKQFPSSLSLPPPEGPNSGYLVIQDEDSIGTTCFGLCKDKYIHEMPFPQNKILTVEYSTTSGHNPTTGTQNHVRYTDDVYFIPALNQPLSSNRYYVIKAHGRHKGEAYATSNEEETCCCFNTIKEMKPRELDHKDVYQQIEVIALEMTCCGPSGYVARSVAQDGVPPRFLARKGWKVYTSTPRHYQLCEAQGINYSLRARLPQFDFPLSTKSSEIMVVGKWYSPFMFINEEGKLKDQMKRSMFYEITLEQQWKQIYEGENNLNDHNNFVAVDVSVQREVALLFGNEALHNHTQVTEGVIWFSTVNGEGRGGESKVGLSSAVMERMRWEQERVGWVGGNEKQVRIERVEEFEGGKDGWKKYGCYVLVERFVFKRMDGSLLLTYEFRHAHQIRSKWE